MKYKTIKIYIFFLPLFVMVGGFIYDPFFCSHMENGVNNSDTDELVPVVTGYGEGLFEIGDLIHWDDFEHLNHWNFQIQESEHRTEPRIEVKGGKMNVLMPARGATIWFRHKIEGPVAIVYNVKAPTTHQHIDGVVPRDINKFWHASNPEKPEELFNHEKYTGAFPSYHKQHGYYSSTGGRDNTTTRFRSYPRQTPDGEPLNHISLSYRDGDENFLINPDQTHTIQVVAFDDVLQYIVDGRVTYEIREGDNVTVELADGSNLEVEYTSERFPVYTEGWFGFRMVRTHHIFSNFRVYRLNHVE